VQSCHRYAYDVGLFDHDPSLVTNVSPCCADPLITGADVLAGGAGTDTTPV
jgi:hypothetical protein